MTEPTLNSYGRVFIRENKRGRFQYHSCMKLGPIDKTFGTVTHILSQDKDGRTVPVASMQEGGGENTSSISGYLPQQERSILERLQNKPPFQVQIHYGTCTRPDDFVNFDSAIVLNDVNLTSYGISDAVARSPAERAVIEENCALSIGSFYRVVNASLRNVYNANEGYLIRSIRHTPVDDCEGVNNEVWIALVYIAEHVMFVYSTDNGITWNEALASMYVHTGAFWEITMELVGDSVYLAIQYNDDLVITKTRISSILNTTADDWPIIYTKEITNIQDMSATPRYVWCAGGEGASTLVRIDRESNLVDEIETDSISEELLAIHALNDNYVGILGGSGVVFLLRNGHWEVRNTLSETGVHDIYLLNERDWIITSETNIITTNDAGLTWTRVVDFSPSVTSSKIDFYDDTLGVVATNSTLYRTLDSGKSWTVVRSLQFTPNQVADISFADDDPNNMMVASQASILAI